MASCAAWEARLCDALVRHFPEQELALRTDFELLMGRIGAGGIEELDARDGTILQIRPKARDSSVRTPPIGRMK